MFFVAETLPKIRWHQSATFCFFFFGCVANWQELKNLIDVQQEWGWLWYIYFFIICTLYRVSKMDWIQSKGFLVQSILDILYLHSGLKSEKSTCAKEDAKVHVFWNFLSNKGQCIFSYAFTRSRDFHNSRLLHYG